MLRCERVFTRPPLRRDRGRQPAGFRRAELRDEIVAGLLDELARLPEVGLQPEVVFEDLAVDHHGPDVRDIRRADHRPHRIDDRCHVDGLRIDDDEVGLLARGQRARAVGDPGDLGAIDRRPAQDLPRIDEIRRRGVAVEVLVPRVLVAACALGREDRMHLGELVSGRGRRDVGGEADRDAHLGRHRGRRPAVPHLQLDLRRE